MTSSGRFREPGKHAGCRTIHATHVPDDVDARGRQEAVRLRTFTHPPWEFPTSPRSEEARMKARSATSCIDWFTVDNEDQHAVARRDPSAHPARRGFVFQNLLINSADPIVVSEGQMRVNEPAVFWSLRRLAAGRPRGLTDEIAGPGGRYVLHR